MYLTSYFNVYIFFAFAAITKRKWGGYYQIINTTLYNVAAFDPSSQSYTYSINQNAGTKVKTAGQYYSVQFGVRYSF